MTAWWESLSALQRVFACFAVPATLILLIQTVLVLFGLGGHDGDTGDGIDGGGHEFAGGHFGGHDGSHDGGDFGGHAGHDGQDGPTGLALFSIRGIMAFFTVGGWAGVAAAGLLASPFIAVPIALVCGTVALYSIAVLFKMTAKLQSAGNLSLDNAVGKTAQVYIRIPGGGKGAGKVVLTFQERFAEVDAVTETPDDIKAGTRVVVSGLFDEDTLVVEPVPESPENNLVEEEKWKH